VATTLIPLGRSLQRLAARPDYFGSPRVVVAVTGDLAVGPEAPWLGARLFLGYQPAAEVIEAISYNAAAGRFEFEEIVGHRSGPAEAQPAERRVCLDCHQGQAPIFARPLEIGAERKPMVKDVGYAAQPLDGIWLRAPCLHNGSVPTLAALLDPPAARPVVFWRGCDIYDPEGVGFRSGPPDDDCPRAWRMDARLRGEGNGGDLYGTDLPDGQKRALLEYLKTL